jgi:hypothetical protein
MSASLVAAAGSTTSRLFATRSGSATNS